MKDTDRRLSHNIQAPEEVRRDVFTMSMYAKKRMTGVWQMELLQEENGNTGEGFIFLISSRAQTDKILCQLGNLHAHTSLRTSSTTSGVCFGPYSQ